MISFSLENSTTVNCRGQMIYGRIFTIIIIICTISLFFAGALQADGNPEEIKIPQALSAGLHHLLDLADPDKTVSFDPEKVALVLGFINEPKKKSALYFADEIRRAPSAYYEFDIKKNLDEIVAYSYNPQIPLITTVPSSARLLYWMDARKNPRASPYIGQYVSQLDSPVIVRGAQYIEITPDTHSGAYYGYDNYQTMILFKYRQRKILVTISKQMDVSSVGKKGYVLGTDDDWDYFYSGKPGLTIPALGWVKSYMYGSSGINIYDEVDPLAPKVRCAVFRWLRAGWSGINMVRRKHIYSGLKRFAKPMKEILEYPALPSVKTMTADFSRIRGLSHDALKSKMAIYSKILEKRYANSGNAKKISADIFKNKSHWTSLSRDEMESTLAIEYMKLAVGKTRKEDVGLLFE